MRTAFKCMGGTRFTGEQRNMNCVQRFSKLLKLCKRATKPREFGSLDNITQTYSIISVLRFARDQPPV